MIALPVLGVTAADVVLQTSQLSGAESLDRRLGAADARVSFQAGVARVRRSFDPDDASSGDGGRTRRCVRGLAESPALGRAVHGVRGSAATSASSTDTASLMRRPEVELTDPLADGLFDVTGSRAGGRRRGRGELGARRPGLRARRPARARRWRDARRWSGIGESTEYRDSPCSPAPPTGHGDHAGCRPGWSVAAPSPGTRCRRSTRSAAWCSPGR